MALRLRLSYTRGMATIVIPAHDEAEVIGRTLRSITPEGWREVYEIIVACNGCTDATAQIARSFVGVNVLETEVGSKIVALNMADEAASGFPRIYLDADIETSLRAIRRVIEVLESGEADVAAPAAVLDTSACSFLARRYYETWSKTGYFKNAIGSGFLGMSEAGRRRFEAWPNIIPDDEYARLVVPPHRRRVVRDVSFVIRPPTEIRSAIHTRARHYLGNYQLQESYPEIWRTKEPASSLLQSVAAEPSMLPWLGLYLGVGVASRLQARAKLKSGALAWYKDQTARQGSTGS
ncbi:MAG: glycosyltransferase family A protein [Myxococcota bacterium]